MTRSIIIACALAIGSSLGFAEDQPSTLGQSPATASSAQHQPEHMQLFDSSLIENKRVMDQNGKDIGKLERLLIDSPSGRVRFIVVQVDKEWSLNDPEVIIPWGTLQVSRVGDKDYALKIDTTRDKLLGAPRFDKALVRQLNTREAGQPIYTYWGVTWQDDMSSTGTAQTGATPPVTDSTSTTTSTELSRSSSPTSTSPATQSTTSTPTVTTEESTTAPTTTTDGSLGKQPLGNTGTTDSPKPDSQSGQPSPDSSSAQPLDPEYEADEPDRSIGGNETD